MRLICFIYLGKVSRNDWMMLTLSISRDMNDKGASHFIINLKIP